jgi:hypothetical protein
MREGRKRGRSRVVSVDMHDGELRRAEAGVTAVKSTSYLAELEGGGAGHELDSRRGAAAKLRGGANGTVAPRLALLPLRASGEGEARENGE